MGKVRPGEVEGLPGVYIPKRAVAVTAGWMGSWGLAADGPACCTLPFPDLRPLPTLPAHPEALAFHSAFPRVSPNILVLSRSFPPFRLALLRTCLSRLFPSLFLSLYDFLVLRHGLFSFARPLPFPALHIFFILGWKFPLPDLCSTPALPAEILLILHLQVSAQMSRPLGNLP